MTRAEQIDTMLKKNPSMKPKQIAETLEIAPSTVYHHLARMRKQRRRATAIAAKRPSVSRTVKAESPTLDRITGEIDEEIVATRDYLARLEGAHDALAA